jgi:hypothetical protein
MHKIIWTCWFQGRHNAPDLVQRCITSWEVQNPEWQVRCLDATTVGRYLDMDSFVDLTRQTLTAASLSDMIRILLLHEYGGVWVDATVCCNQPLDAWLASACGTGFFAFSAPAPGRLLSSWFLAAEPNNQLVSRWAAMAVNYWRERTETDDYYWFHHLFGILCQVNPEARTAWDRVPRISAEGPHMLQAPGLLFEPAASATGKVDWTIPVFKLTYRIDPRASTPGTLLDHVLRRCTQPRASSREMSGVRANGSTSTSNLFHVLRRRLRAARHDPGRSTGSAATPPIRFAGLRVQTANLGDHVQLLAANQLLKRLGVQPDVLVDRDDEIASSAALDQLPEPVGILLNGWFKTNPSEWPPHPKLVPIYLGFHIRLFQSPSLISKRAIEHYRRYGPVGCRDVYTQALLQQHGVDAFHSNCLSLLLPRRFEDRERQREVFVVSRDERILDYLPDGLQPYTFVNQYSGSSDFATNMQAAAELLEMYGTRARLIVTTTLHCTLPAIAMGIPVVVFYPLNPAEQHGSDRERFSSLERMIRVHTLSEADGVDWRGRVVDVSQAKIALLDEFYRMAERWHTPPPRPLGPIAASDRLPVPVA